MSTPTRGWHLLTKPKALLRALHNEEASVSISFMLVFPIYLTIVGVLVQFSLLLAAKIVVEHAAIVAARSATTCLTEPAFIVDRSAQPAQAAALILAQLSPKGNSGISAPVQAAYDAMLDVSVTPGASFPARYQYALETTTVTWQGNNFDRRMSQPITVSVSYPFRLTVPGVMAFIAPNVETKAGLDGHYITLKSEATVMTGHGRSTRSDAQGWAY
ncbi:MAG: hypothetical protein WCJ97_03540 [Phycisphaerae bacterium]